MDRETAITRALRVLGLVVLSTAIALALVQALKLLGTSGVVILASILLTYLVVPVVGFFRRWLPLVWALTITFVIIAAVFILALVLIVPPLLAEARSLILELPKAAAMLQSELADPKNPIISKLPPDLRNDINTLPAQASQLVAKYGLGVAQATLGGFFSIVALFLSLIVVPIFCAYLFFDAPELKRGFIGMIPEGARPKTLAILSDLNKTIGAFVRGQALDGLILGTMIAVMLTILHVPYALLIGVAAGILNIIPYLGAVIGFIPAVLLALIFNGWQNAVIVGILFGVIQQIDGNVILPRVMKDSVQLSPLIIIAAILIFSAYFGIMGTFLAVPIAAMLRVLKLHFAPAPPAAEMATDEKSALKLQVL